MSNHANKYTGARTKQAPVLQERAGFRIEVLSSPSRPLFPLVPLGFPALPRGASPLAELREQTSFLQRPLTTASDAIDWKEEEANPPGLKRAVVYRDASKCQGYLQGVRDG